MNNKGISSVIGTIFLVLTVFLVASSVFLLNLAESARYNQTVKDLRQTEADRFSERVGTSYAQYSIPEADTVLVDITISNEGPGSAQIITVWVLWAVEEETKYGFNDTLNINLKPSETLPVAITVTIRDVNSTGSFSGWLITTRGNAVSLEKEQIVVHSQVSEGIGSVMMDFDSFKYYKEEGSVLNFSESKLAFTVHSGESIVLAAFLSNYDLKRRTLTLHSDSLLWAYFPKSPGTKAIWNIINVASNGTIIEDPYIPISLAYGESKWIFFGPYSISDALKYESGAVNLILLGKIDGQDYGQNLPFVSIYVTS